MKKFIVLLLTMIIIVMASCSSKDDGSNDTIIPSDTIADTEEIIETEPPLPETTTVRETQPPKEYERISVFKIDFTTMEDGTAPFSANNVDNLRIEGGLLKGTATNGDPHMVYKEDMELDSSTIQEIHIKLKNYSSDSNFQFFFTTEETSWSESASIKDYLLYSDFDGDKNEWNDIVVYPEMSYDWSGTITGFRIDPFSDVGDFEIEFVDFISVTEK